MEVKRTTDKIEEDFFGAIQHWGDKMGRWAFVHNQWRGVPPDVLRKLLDIDGKNSTVVENWCEVELRNEFFQLKVEDQQALLGPSPTGQTITAIQMKDVVIVVNVVAHRAIVTYGEISALLYQRPAKFTPTETTNGPQFKIEVQGERSPRISNMQIFCFDMMLMQIVSARSMGPGFLIHDSHLFDPVDSRQVGTALQLGATLATENKFQYIVTLNSDKQIESPEGFTLSDYGMSVKLMDVTETGGLFGLRFG